MKTLRADDNGIAEAVAVLHDGGVVAHATETCYGLACDLTNHNAVTRLFQLKHRKEDAPVSALFPHFEATLPYADWPEDAERMAREKLPGPWTFIVPLRADAPAQLYLCPNGIDKIGIRVSSHSIAAQLAKAYPVPLSTTSANIHQHPSCYSAAAIVGHFSDQPVQPDLILDSGPLEQRPSSKVIDLSGDEMKMIRE